MFIPNTLRNTKINLNAFDALDFDQLQRNHDFDTLQSFIIPLQQGFTQEREFRQPENTIKYLKLIYLMQMMLLYLEYTKQYQEYTIDQLYQEEFKLENNIDDIEKKLSNSKKLIQKLKVKQRTGKIELHKKKLEASQKETVYACLYCTGKAFITIPLLEAHYQRHHIDKFEKPKQNFQETLLTVQTLLLQQQINSMINNQNQQDFMLQTMQEAQFMQQEADESDSSEEEDLEEVAVDDFQVRQMKLEFEQKTIILQQQMESLQAFIQVNRPKEILEKIDELEYRLDHLKIPEPIIPEEKIPTPPPENYSFNAGPLEDEISELADDKDIYDAHDQQQDIKEEVTNDSKSNDSKEPSIIIDNQQEAAFLQEEREFHHLLKSVKEKKSIITKQQMDQFRYNYLDNELERKLKELITINLSELQQKNEKELEDYLISLGGKLPISDRKSPQKKNNNDEGNLEDIQKKDPLIVQINKENNAEQVSLFSAFTRGNKRQGKTIVETKGVRFEQQNNSPQSNNSLENNEENQGIKKQFFSKSEALIQMEEQDNNNQFVKSPKQLNELKLQSQQQKQPEQQQQPKQNQQKKQEEIKDFQEQISSKRKSSFEDSDDFQNQNIQTIFNMRKPQQQQQSQFNKNNEQEIPIHESIKSNFQQKNLIKTQKLLDEDEDF